MMVYLFITAALLTALGLANYIQKQHKLMQRAYQVLQPYGVIPPSRNNWQTIPLLIGEFMAKRLLSGKDRLELNNKLAEAGFSQNNRLNAFMLAKLGCYTLAVSVCLVVYSTPEQWQIEAVAVLIMSLVGSGILAEAVLTELAKRRLTLLRKRMPEALDLLVICLESGLSLDAAIEQVALRLKQSCPELCKEFALLYTELQVLPDREVALHNLVKRADIDETRLLATTLIQANNYGAAIAESLKVLAKENRDKRLSMMEEAAAKVPAKLSLPMITMILFPAIALIAAPSMIQLLRTLSGN